VDTAAKAFSCGSLPPRTDVHVNRRHVLVALAFLVNFTVDMIYAVLDPRIRR